MTTQLNNSQDFVRNWVAKRASDSSAFRAFGGKYRTKIESKIRRCKTEDQLDDLVFELEVGSLLIKNPELQLEYEAYGSGRLRSPDYRTTMASQSFNIEVTRIREAVPERRLKVLEKEFKETIRAVPSKVGVMLDILDRVTTEQLLDQLEVQRERIKTEMRKAITKADGCIQASEIKEYSIPANNGLIEIEISKCEAERNSGRSTSCYGGELPIPYTQQEFRKFGDIICVKLGQCHAGMPNVLIIGSQNGTHEDIDLDEAIRELWRHADSGDDEFFRNKGFEGAADFHRQYLNLSATVFRSSWTGDVDRNFVWLNPDAASPLVEKVVDFLCTMD